MAQMYRKEGLGEYKSPVRLREGGPEVGVDWCVPILPGVLLADSYYVIAPLSTN